MTDVGIETPDFKNLLVTFDGEVNVGDLIRMLTRLDEQGFSRVRVNYNELRFRKDEGDDQSNG